jgi:hypothetical protein
MNVKTILSVVVLLNVGFGGFAHATPIKWTLSGVTFNDGGTASGSFFFDAATNAFSSVSITTTPGTAFAGTSYSSLYPGIPLPAATYPGFITNFYPGTKINEYNMSLALTSAMTSTGGTRTILTGPSSPAGEYVCLLETCAFSPSGPPGVFKYRSIIAGSITAPVSVVPIPAAVWLFGSALGVMGVMRRKATS